MVIVYMVTKMQVDGNEHDHEGCFPGLRKQTTVHLKQQQPAMCLLYTTVPTCLMNAFTFFAETVLLLQLCS